MMSDDRDCDAVRGIPLSYMLLMYIPLNILNNNLTSLCITYSLCLTYIQQLSDIFTMRHKELV